MGIAFGVGGGGAGDAAGRRDAVNDCRATDRGCGEHGDRAGGGDDGHAQLFLQHSGPLRDLDGTAGLRVVLAADGGGGGHELAAVRAWRALDVHGLRLVLEIVLHVGLGSVSLWAMAPERPAWLGVGPGHAVGSSLGDLAALRWLLRLGTVAAGRGLCIGDRDDLLRQPGELRVWVWVFLELLHLCAGPPFLLAPAMELLRASWARGPDLQQFHRDQQLRPG